MASDPQSIFPYVAVLRTLGATLLALHLLVAPSAAFGQPVLTIEKVVWTDSIDRGSREHRAVLVSPSRSRSAALWMRVRGNEELLDRIRASPGGRVPLRHTWYQFDTDRLERESAVTVDLTVGRSSDLNLLGYQLAAEGSFTWRVWSARDQLAAGIWVVEVEVEVGPDSLGDIECPTGSSRDGRCYFELEIR